MESSKSLLTDCQNNKLNGNITELHYLQKKEMLHLGNKLRSEHIHYHYQKMKVRLATQLLSLLSQLLVKSVAQALEVCEQHLCLP